MTKDSTSQTKSSQSNWFKKSAMALPVMLCVVLLGAVVLLAANDDSNPPYVNPYSAEVIQSTRLCEQMRFSCLKESQDAAWQQVFTNPVYDWESKFARQKLGGILNFRDSGSLPMTDYNREDLYKLSEAEQQAASEREYLILIDEIAQMLELYLPGFWQHPETNEIADKHTQRQWLLKAVAKAEQFEFNHSRGQVEGFVHLCALLGVDFDQDPKNKLVVDFLRNKEFAGSLSQTIDYLYYVILGRDFDVAGNHLNNWSLKNALRNLPYPKRKLTNFDDVEQNYDETYDMWTVYKKTIRYGGHDI